MGRTVRANTQRNKDKWEHLQVFCDENGDQRVTLDEFELGFVKFAGLQLDGFILDAGRSSKLLADLVEKVHAQFNASVCESALQRTTDFLPPDTASNAPPSLFSFLFNRS